MRPCEYRRSVEIKAPIEQVFAFHADPRNVKKISPSWQRVEIVQAGAGRVNDEFVIQVYLLGYIPIKWRGIWREVLSPNLLVDEALQSPFAYWRHHHQFGRLDTHRTLMTDHIRYLFPGGWLGKLFGETLGRLQFVLMFADRQKRTRRWFDEHAQS